MNYSVCLSRDFISSIILFSKSGFLLPKSKNIECKHIHPAAFNARLRSVAIKLNVEYFHFHCLRHTFVTSLIENDINPSITKELVRHGNIKTTLDIYIHVKKENKKEAMHKVFGGGRER